MRVVGVFYVLQFVAMAIVRAPIRTFGPDGALEQADAGEPVASFLVDTWLIFGLEVLAVGVCLLIASRRQALAAGVVWTVIAIESSRGILADSIMIVRGIEVAGYLVWIAIHSTVIVTGLRAIRAARREHGWGGHSVGAPSHSQPV
jgi:hypothetical protein